MEHSSIIGFESILIVIVCIINGLRLVFSSEVRQSSYKRYRITCYCLAGACACLAIGNAMLLIKFGMEYMTTEVCSVISTTISASQSLLFTIALIVLYTNQGIKYTRVLQQAVPIVAFTLLYFIATRFQPNIVVYTLSDLLGNVPTNLPSTVRLLYTFTYIIQCGIFTQAFLKVRREYLIQAEQAVEVATSEIRLEWIRVAFFSALAEGILAFFTILLFPGFISDFIFKTATILFYIVFPIYYINYSKTYNKVKALIEESLESRLNQPQSTPSYEEKESEGMDAMLIKLIEKNNLLFQKAENHMKESLCFLNSETKAEDLVSAIGTNRTYLANAIKQNQQCTISDYIMRYRLEYAKSVLQQKNLKMEDVAFTSGFNSLRTFNRNFKDNFGITPEEFRNSLFTTNTLSNQ